MLKVLLYPFLASNADCVCGEPQLESLAITLHLMSCLVLNLPRAGCDLLSLTSFHNLVASICSKSLPPILPPPPKSNAVPVLDLEQIEERSKRTSVAIALIGLLERCAWEPDEQSISKSVAPTRSRMT